MKRDQAWPVVLIAVTLLVRWVYLWELSRHADFAVPMVDEKFFWLWAQDILNNSFWGDGAYFRAPLYGYFLAFLHLVTSGSIFWMKYLQLLLCGGTVFYLYKLTEYLCNRTAAIIAGFIYALYGTAVFYEAMFLIPVLFLFLLVWGMYRLIVHHEKLSPVSLIITGLIFGLAALARPNILLVVPFLMLWLFWKSDKQFSAKLRKPVLLFLGVVIAILPVTVRNYAVTGELILISSQGGINLYLGNNPSADGLTMLMPEVALDESVSWDQFEQVTINAAEKESGKALSASEASSFWTSKTIGYITDNPGEFLGRLYKKTIYLFSGIENSDNADIYYGRTRSKLFSLLVWNNGLYFPFGLLFPLTVAGLLLTWDKRKKLLPLYIYLLFYVPSIILFLVTARHRLPLIPFMIILAGAGMYNIIQYVKENNYRQLFLPGIVFVILLAGFNRTYFDESRTGSMFQVYFNNGLRAEKIGDLQKAEAEYKKAEQEFPQSTVLLNNLGFVQYQLGKYAEAAEKYRRAISIQPDFTGAYNNLGLLYQEFNKHDSALIIFKKAFRSINPDRVQPGERSKILLNIAVSFGALSINDSAAIYFNRAADEDPSSDNPIRQSAIFYAQNGQFVISDSLYAELEETGRIKTSDYFNWGLSYLPRKNFEKVREKMFIVAKQDDNFYQAYHLIAVSYFEEGYPDDAIYPYLNRALTLNPNYQPSLSLQSALRNK